MILLLFINIILAAIAGINFITIGKLRTSDFPEQILKIIMPIRNEYHNLPVILKALEQELKNSNNYLVIVDDQSTDGSLDLIQEITSSWDKASRDRLFLVNGEDKPTGWVGKSWAIAQGVEIGPKTELYLFIDADIAFQPNAIAATAHYLMENNFGAVSPYPKQIAKTFSEKLIQPLLHWSWSTTLLIKQAGQSRRSSTVVANGQFLMVKREAYESAGGVENIKHAVLDDLALAKAIRKAGYKTTVVDGHDFISCRMYQNWSGLRDGYSKSLWEAFGGYIGTALVLIFYLATSFLPLIGGLANQNYAWAALGFIILSRYITAFRYDESLISPLFHPVAILVFIYLTLRSNYLKVNSKLSWKERSL